MCDTCKTLIGALETFTNQVEKLAFKMPPPNSFTPQFVELVCAARHFAIQHRIQIEEQHDKCPHEKLWDDCPDCRH